MILPRLLAEDTNIAVKARTGTGKTAAFGLPLVNKLTEPADKPQALILAPTRELALQISNVISEAFGLYVSTLPHTSTV